MLFTKIVNYQYAFEKFHIVASESQNASLNKVHDNYTSF